MLVTPKCVLWQIAKTQMNSQSGSTLYSKTNTIFIEIHVLFEKYNTCNPAIQTMAHPEFIVSNQKEESAQRVGDVGKKTKLKLCLIIIHKPHLYSVILQLF